MNCPHCGNHLSYTNPRHISACPANPDTRAGYAAALENPRHPGQCYTCHGYDAQRSGFGLYGSDTIRRVLDMTWPEVAKFFGLQPAPHGTGMRDAAVRRKQAAATLAAVGAEIDGALAEVAGVEDEWEAARDGLPVLRYRTRQIGNAYQRTYEIR